MKDDLLVVAVGDKFTKTTKYLNTCFEWRFNNLFGRCPDSTTDPLDAVLWT